MKIIYLIRSELQIYPPCLSQILYLNGFGIEIVVAYGSCNQNVKNMLETKGVRCIDLELNRSNSRMCERIHSINEYHVKASKLLKQEYENNDIVWFGTADSGFFLQGKILKNKKYVLNVLELYDKNRFYRKNIGKIIYDAHTVICCEQTRADIMKSWWKLEKKPYVLPNKPYSHPMRRNIGGTIDVTRNMIRQFSDRTSILYQGIFSKDRDVGKLAKALDDLNMNVGLYLLGNDKNGVAKEIKKIYQKTVHLGFAPAPFHLEVTSHAMIGVAVYDDSSLNNLFCAPNKIYEYCGFGIPVLCSDVPGLRNTIEKFQAGVCVDFDDTESILHGIIKIIENYETYSANAVTFYQSTDNEKTMLEIVNELGFSVIEE